MKLRLAALLSLTLLSACRSAGDVVEGGGVYAVRSTCPVPGVPAGTGDVTLFNPPESRDSRAIDVTAAISNVRNSCQDAGNDVVSALTFTVTAQRREAGPARQVNLPIFNVALQGGGRIAAKRIGNVSLNFPAGGVKTWTTAQVHVRVNRAAATLPDNVREILNRPRRAGQAEAAIDPMSDPAVRAAVANATFEHLVGFNLTQEQLRYNVTR